MKYEERIKPMSIKNFNEYLKKRERAVRTKNIERDSNT